MKYCPHCGAAQEVGAAAFCPECGRLRQGSSPSAQLPKASAPRKKKKRRPSAKANSVKQRSADDGYDGYYRDTPVADGGQVRAGLDPVLAKKIVLLSFGVLLVILLAVLAMHFL